MATLSAGINATQTVIPVSGAAPATNTYWTVGSENVRFLGTSRGPQGRSFLRDYWSVDRGVGGSTAATHANGASLTQYYPDAAGGGGGSISATDGVTTVDPATSIVFPAGTLEDSGGGVATVALIPTLLGPFHIDHDRAGLGDNASSFASLPAGTVVLRVWGEHITEWDGPQAGDKLIVALRGFGASTNDYNTLILLDLNSTTPSQEASVGAVLEAPFFDPTAWPQVGRLTEAGAGDLVVDAILTSVGTTGRTDIYAIIATPAS